MARRREPAPDYCRRAHVYYWYERSYRRGGRSACARGRRTSSPVGLPTEVGYQSNLQSPAPKIAVISAPLVAQRGLIQIIGSTLTVTGTSLNTVIHGRCIGL